MSKIDEIVNEEFLKRMEVKYEICALSYFVHMTHVSYYIHQYVIIQLLLFFIDSYSLRCGITLLQVNSMRVCFGIYSTLEVFTLCTQTMLAKFISLLITIHTIIVGTVSTLYTFFDIFRWYIKAIYYNRKIVGMLSFTLKSMVEVDYILETPSLLCKFSSLYSSVVNLFIRLLNRLEDKIRRYNFEGYGRYISIINF